MSDEQRDDLLSPRNWPVTEKSKEAEECPFPPQQTPKTCRHGIDRQAKCRECGEGPRTENGP